MRNILITVLPLLLPSCTIMQPRNVPLDFASECQSVECVVDAVDTLRDREEYGGTRFDIMEGYEDTYLRQMLKDGRLTISHINPLYPLILGVFGYAEVRPGKYGEVWKCNVEYIPLDTYFLVHELLHCQGYTDRGVLNPLFFLNSYTKEQRRIMEEEGKDRWTDTQFYKDKRFITEDYIFKQEVQ